GTATWVNSNYYELRGAVFVRDGATLNIQAGTTVIGESWSTGTLVVERGGRLNAIGTAAAPIVFTSDQPEGSRNRGDWGGLIINGRATLNVPGGVASGEGSTGQYGGTDDNDNSGTLKYVRVEFAGVEFSPDNELNGIAFQGVGRGTVVDYVQVHMNRDDALEFFGGTVDVKHAVLSNTADDSFDWTQGWRGRVQFVAITQRSDDADWGIEADSNSSNHNFLPRANPQIYNMTICGDPDRNEGGESVRAVLFRVGTAVTFRNFIILGSKTLGMQMNDAATLEQVANGTTQVGAGIISGPTTPLHSSVAGFVSSGRFPDVRVNPGNVGLTAAGCANHAAPNFQPSLASLAGGQMSPIQPPNDGFFEPVTFIGAVPPAPAANWMDGWTSFPQN
ncbi:MAG: T9SS C-terminal target domain-containing protein, partial [Vicinamibacterales bacterium]